MYLSTDLLPTCKMKSTFGALVTYKVGPGWLSGSITVTHLIPGSASHLIPELALK
jgi:hypothetical protein